MPPRSSRVLGASSAAPATLPDLHMHETVDETMNLDVPEQLLTPENSRSETSSNNENALSDEKRAVRRSTRVARASLRAIEALDSNTPGKRKKSTSSPSEAYVESLAKAKRSQSSLRHSIAVMESSLWSGTLTQHDTILDDQAMAPDTPDSKSSQEPQLEDMNTSFQQRTLRKRVEKAFAKDEGKAKAAPAKSSSRNSLRRSTRLSLMDRASDLVDRANSVLGKRSRDEKGQDLGRRASLRPRPPKEEAAASASNEPSVKKRRVSESDLEKLRDAKKAADSAVRRPKPKRWLTHGLYTGQEPSDSRPKQRRSKNSKRTSTGPMLRKILPMPMFAGARLLKGGRDFQLPFDIFSPLPSGQPKPDEWRKTSKNVFVGDAASFWKANKPLELSTCMCTEDTGCDENCQNRYMFYECDNSNCRLGSECGNRSFDELKHRTKAGGKYNIGVEVIKTPDRGYGVRSNRSFEPNQIIVEYTGEIITQIECERRMRTTYKNDKCYYLMYFDQNMIIDATRGSIARFVNHSCEPNCRMEKWTVAGKPRMALFAGDRGVMTGEELSYDYNFDPYSNKNVQQCRCGSSNCRGILGPRPKDKAQRIKENEDGQKAAGDPRKVTAKKVVGTKRKLADASDGAASRQRKKRKLLEPKSIKAGVKKVITKARTARGKTAAKKAATASKTTGRGRAAAKSKANVKLPKVKATTRVKAAVRGRGKGKTTSATITPSSPSKKTASQLKRPSAETKRQILAAAAKGSGRKMPTKTKKTETTSPPRKAPARKAPAKSPVKAKMPASKAKAAATVSTSPVKTRGLTRGVKRAARGVVRSVRGAKKE